jgi:hypothetical protein
VSGATRTLTRNARRDAVRREKQRRALHGRVARRPPPPGVPLSPLAANPSRIDPSRTGALRVRAGAAVRARYDRLRTELYRKVVLEDALGLSDEVPAWFRAAHDAGAVGNRFNPSEARDERGRWAAVGGRALSALQRAGAHVGHLEHSAKSYVADRLEAGVSRLPAGLQHAVRATVHVGRAGTRAAFVTWTAGQALAERVSRERGATPEQARRLRAVVSALDLATFKPLSLGLHAAGVSAATLGLTSFVPPASAAYLAYSTARDPVATWRAAKGLVRDAAYRAGVALAGGTVRNSALTSAEEVADYLARHDTDLAFAVLLAAVEATGDLRTALPLAAEAVRDVPVGNSFNPNQPRDAGGRFAQVRGGGTPAEIERNIRSRPGAKESHEHTKTSDGREIENLLTVVPRSQRDAAFKDVMKWAGRDETHMKEFTFSTDQLSRMVTAQPNLKEENLVKWVKAEKVPGGADAFLHDGKVYLRDANHRVSAAVLRGESFTVRLVLRKDSDFAPEHLIRNDDPTFNAGLWDLLPTADRLRAFGGWLRDTATDLWRGLEETLRGIIELAIRKGAGRSFDEARSGHFLDPNFRGGARQEFVDGVLRDSDNRERFDALRKRSGDEVANHRDSVVEKVERSISDAVVQDKSPQQAWREITTVIDRERDSATTTVHDEVVRGHAEGQVAGFEEAGVTELFPLMEWTIHPEASKSGVCPRCRALKGTVWTVSDARGKIPLHRNCRCTWTARPPEGTPTRRQPSPAPTYYAPGAGAKFKTNADAPGNCGTGAGGFRPGNTCASGGSVGAGETVSLKGKTLYRATNDPSAKLSEATGGHQAIGAGVYLADSADAVKGYGTHVKKFTVTGEYFLRVKGDKEMDVIRVEAKAWAEKSVASHLADVAAGKATPDAGRISRAYHPAEQVRDYLESKGFHGVQYVRTDNNVDHHDQILVFRPEKLAGEVTTKNAQARDALGRFAGLSVGAAAYAATAWYNGNAGRKAAHELPPARQEKLARSYAAQVLSAERSGKHDVAAELAHAAPALLPGARLLSHAGAVEPYDGGRHEGALAGHRGDVRVTRPGIEFDKSHNARLMGGGGGHAVVLRARAEPVGTTNRDVQGEPRDGEGKWAAGGSVGGRGAGSREGTPHVGSTAERTASTRLATAKVKAAPVPGPDKVAKMRAALKLAREGKGRPGGDARGSSTDRRRRAENLFREFGGGDRGYVVCPWTGIKMHWSADPALNPNGYPKFEQGKIFTACQGGGYQLPNLIPESFAANRSRNDRRLRKENARGC